MDEGDIRERRDGGKHFVSRVAISVGSFLERFFFGRKLVCRAELLLGRKNMGLHLRFLLPLSEKEGEKMLSSSLLFAPRAKMFKILHAEIHKVGFFLERGKGGRGERGQDQGLQFEFPQIFANFAFTKRPRNFAKKIFFIKNRKS